MCVVLIVDDDVIATASIEHRLTLAGHHVCSASSTAEAVRLLERRHIDLVLARPHVCAMSPPGLFPRSSTAPLIFAGAATPEVAAAVQIATSSVRAHLDSPTASNGADVRVRSLQFVRPAAAVCVDCADDIEPHATARWAKAVAGIIHSPTDPRTLSRWGLCIAASPGAIRNWCYTAGLGPRQSLLLGRMLRAFLLSKGTNLPLPDLLDVVDRRTVLKMLRVAGLPSERALPADVTSFLHTQSLIQDPRALGEIERALQSADTSRRDDERRKQTR